MKSLMGKVITHIPNPLPQRNIFTMEPFCAHQDLSFRITSPQVLSVFDSDVIPIPMDLYLRFAIGDWSYETEVRRVGQQTNNNSISFPILWNNEVIHGRYKQQEPQEESVRERHGNITDSIHHSCSHELLFGDALPCTMPLRIELFHAHHSQPNELLGTSEFDLLHTFELVGIQEIDLTLMNGFETVGTVHFQLSLEPQRQEHTNAHTNSDRYMNTQHLNQHNQEKLKIQQTQTQQVSGANSSRARVSSPLPQRRHQPQQQREQQARDTSPLPPQPVSIRTRPRSAVLSTRVVRIEGSLASPINSTTPKPTVDSPVPARPSSASGRTRVRTRGQVPYKFRQKQHSVPIAFFPIVSKPNPNDVPEIRGSKWKQTENRGDAKRATEEGLLAQRRAVAISYNRTITTDRTASSTTCCLFSFDERDTSASAAAASASASGSPQDLFSTPLSLEIPEMMPLSTPLAPQSQFPSPFSQQQQQREQQERSGPGTGRGGGGAVATARLLQHNRLRVLQQSSFLFSHLKSLEIHPDHFFRQVDHSLQLTVWESFYFIPLPRQEIFSLLLHLKTQRQRQRGHGQGLGQQRVQEKGEGEDMELLFSVLSSTLFSSNSCSQSQPHSPETHQPQQLQETQELVVSLMNPISFLTSLLSLSEEEFYSLPSSLFSSLPSSVSSLSPEVIPEILLKQAVPLLTALLSALIGPWPKIRQLLLQQTMQTNQPPRLWSTHFLQILFQSLQLQLHTSPTHNSPPGDSSHGFPVEGSPEVTQGNTESRESREGMTMEQYLLSSEPPSTLLLTPSLTSSSCWSWSWCVCLGRLRWKLYRQLLLMLDDWWRAHAVYPTDILWTHSSPLTSFPPSGGGGGGGPVGGGPVAVCSPVLKENDHVRICGSTSGAGVGLTSVLAWKLFRLYLSLSRVYSWTNATAETLLRLSDLIANQIGIISTHTPIPTHSTHSNSNSLHKLKMKRTLHYGDMVWLTLLTSSPSKVCAGYVERVLGALQDLEPICGKYILVPLDCLRLLVTQPQPPLTPLPTQTHSNSRYTSPNTSLPPPTAAATAQMISLSEVSKDKILTGLTVRVVSLDHLSRIFERVAWWERPNLLTLQSIAGKTAHILSTVSLSETNRVGISIPISRKDRDKGGGSLGGTAAATEVIELIPIEGLLIDSSSLSVPSSAAISVSPIRSLSNKVLVPFPFVEKIEEREEEQQEEPQGEGRGKERFSRVQSDVNDDDTNPAMKIQSQSHCLQSRSYSQESITDSSPLQTIPIPSLKISVSADSSVSAIAPVIRPLYRPTTAAHLRLFSSSLSLPPSLFPSASVSAAAPTADPKSTPRPTYLDFLYPTNALPLPAYSHHIAPSHGFNNPSPAQDSFVLNSESQPKEEPPPEAAETGTARGGTAAEVGVKVGLNEPQDQFSQSFDDHVFPLTVQVKKRPPPGAATAAGEGTWTRTEKKEKVFLGVSGSRRALESSSSSNLKPLSKAGVVATPKTRRPVSASLVR
jgi:hypothetical protein